MIYKYFLGCTNSDGIKSKFKELAKTLHPDKGGKHEEFVAMKIEFDYLNNKINKYPIANQVTNDYFQTLANMNRAREYAQANSVKVTVEDLVDNVVNNYYKEQFTAFTEENLNEVKANNYFNEQRKKDKIYDLLDSFLKQSQSLPVILLNLNKQDDLLLDHFKYICFKLNKDIKMAKVYHRNYINNQAGW